jgi:hypothetical protein
MPETVPHTVNNLAFFGCVGSRAASCTAGQTAKWC